MLLRVIGVSAVTAAAVLCTAGGAWTSAAAPTVATANSITFQDSTGERPDSPDITTVVVSNTNSGDLTFKINPFPRLTDDMLVGIDIDSDANAATGEPNTGLDYAIEVFRGDSALFRWDGTNFTRRQNDPPSATLTFAGPTLTTKINASELGNTTHLKFGVTVITGIVVDSSGELDGTNARLDFAPDQGHGLYDYPVRTAPVRLLAKKFALSPSRPTAGRTLTANLTVARNDTGATLKGGTVACTATVGGARIAVRVHRFVGSQARCAWVIPSSARGKSIRGSITVLFEGKRITRNFAARVG
jgi:hypothetical protein